ncbi:Glycosyltransferase [Thioalkalivibrio nitratireducens DSM 14787]|uniref:Glycosyltransferase n=1 Tax=Thioalkalivibrio nitratireducens (strain DSM 14787 / UNIQEM 213 / ALEN2) TaxID=1255043 RepID=L0DTQ5_THIND|nr:glycosyltransferase [Thioalkalivibrio nitratireducens]AGA31761.1 Glycosyltransferase [Thioalkalivibrio nitratireducens DSM 14787]
MAVEGRRPRVFVLSSTLPRWAGDAEPGFVLDLARELNADFDIELIAPHAPGAARTERMHGVPVTRFRYWWPRWQSVAYQGGMAWRLRENPLRLGQLPFFFASLVWTTIRRLRREPRVDLIHAHWLIPQGLAAIVARVIANRRVPILCTSHGGDLFGLRGPVLTRLKRAILRRCDGISVVSRAMAVRVREIEPGAVAEVIPMGTDLRHRFVPTRDAADRNAWRLVFVGRLVPKKGLEHLLDALHELAGASVPFTAEIVGHGPLADALAERARVLRLHGSVHFSGPVPHKSLAQHYQRAAIAVFPFVEAADGDQEGFGLVMVEAMGCGCAVIASDLPAVRDVIRHGETGILVPPSDPQALAAAIREALEQPERMRAIAERGRAYALENFDWSVTRRRYAALYRSLGSGQE